MDSEQNCDCIFPLQQQHNIQHRHNHDYMQLKQPKQFCNHQYIPLDTPKLHTTSPSLQHDKLCKAIFFVIILLNTPLTDCYIIQKNLSQNDRYSHSDSIGVVEGGGNEVKDIHLNEDTCREELTGEIWTQVIVDSHKHHAGLTLFDFHDSDFHEDDDVSFHRRKRNTKKKKRLDVHGKDAKDIDNVLLRKRNLGSHNTRDGGSRRRRRKHKPNKEQKHKKIRNKKKSHNLGSIHHQPHHLRSINQQPNNLESRNEHSPHHDHFSHKCILEEKYDTLGHDYYPHSLKTGKCNSTSCHLGFYKCLPVMYTVDVMHKIKFCASAKRDLQRLTGVSGETWVWEKKEVVAACTCEEITEPGVYHH